MPRRNAALNKRDEEAQAQASAQRALTKASEEPRKVTLNLDELNVPEGADLPPRMAQVVALRLVGLRPKEIAGQLGISEHTVNQHLYMARLRGRLSDVGQILDNAVVPMAIENLIEGLEAKDKDYTLEVLKGRGAFRSHTHQASTGSNAPMHLQIQIELPKGAHGNVIDVIPGQVMGAPRE